MHQFGLLKKISLAIFIVSFFYCLPTEQVLAAGQYTVSPPLIDYTTEGRDIINRDITLTNIGDRPVRLYVSVHEVNIGDKTEVLDFVPPSMSDRPTSITSWMEITRARIELQSGEEKVIPLTIRIHPATPPGVYHAVIGFVESANRDLVEEKVKSGQASTVLVKIVIDDQRREQLHLVNFTSDRFTFEAGQGLMSYTLENNGDLPVMPTGEIIVYDTRGEELVSLSVNSSSTIINPGEKVKFDQTLPFINRLGKNKAYLALEYGANNQATVFDTLFYYSVPWFYLAVIFVVLLLLLLTTGYIFKRVFSDGNSVTPHEVYELPMFVKDNKEHSVYDHDLNLKNKNDS